MKRLLVSASIVALGFGAAQLWRGRQRRPSLSRRLDLARARERSILPRRDDAAAITQNFIAYFIVPLWAMSGVADWLCHRAASIEATAGAKESLIHLLMLAEMALPVLAGLFLEITSPVLALMIASFLLHEATALWDVAYAVTRREVTFIEQHVHSFLEMMPLMAVSFITVLHWDRFRELLRGSLGGGPAFALKKRPLPAPYIAGTLTNMALFEATPYLEELVRCLRASGGRLVPEGAMSR